MDTSHVLNKNSSNDFRLQIVLIMMLAPALPCIQYSNDVIKSSFLPCRLFFPHDLDSSADAQLEGGTGTDVQHS
jgi:hypothetical protein